MSGSGGGGGYEYQARAIAYIATHVLAHQSLQWIEHSTPDVPIAVAAETNGPGDDINITLQDGTVVELQAKHGLKKDTKFWEAIVELARGLTINPSLYSILLTDSTASGTIKDDLRQDLKRFGQGRTDDLKAITQEVRNKFEREGITNDSALFRRLSIIVVDLDDDSQGAKSAQILLSQAIENQHQARQAWITLVNDGIKLITNRGRRDAEALARLLGNVPIQLSATGTNPAVVAERYKIWLEEITTHFLVPGLGKELPIETAWIQLRAYGSREIQERDCPKTIEEELASYHEWSRLAVRREDHSSNVFDADHITEFSHRTVVIGGPGAGKSTLLKRLAYRLSNLGKSILRVRLPRVAQYFQQGKPFEEAILSDAADGSGIKINQLQLILANPDYLLADGLDECDPQRPDIAKALVSWAGGHSNTKVIVTTRPVGHDAGFLPGWEYTELLPLDSQDIKRNAQQLIKAKFTNETQIEEQLALFEQRLETNRTASLAARNPLLLGFLVQLSLNGVELAQQRAGLYNSIIKLVYDQPLLDRESKIELDTPVALYVIKTIGWILQAKPGISVHELTESLGQKLAGELELKSLAAQREAEKGLKFWEERRIIECLSVGHQDAVTFVHPSLGEYAAGQYAASCLSNQELYEWLEHVRRKPKWRETILLSAGSGAAERISSHLLELDNPEEPTSTEAVLAAAALAEVANPPPELLKKIADRLQQRLTSPIPFVAFEAAEAALGLAAQAPEIIGSIVQSLFRHPQLWTRTVATRLALACGEDYVDLSTLKEVLNDIIAEPASPHASGLPYVHAPKPGRCGRHGWEFQNWVVLNGFELLMRKQPALETIKQVKRLLKEGSFSSGTCESLSKLLAARYPENLKGGNQQEHVELEQEILQEFVEFKKFFAGAPTPQKLLRDLRQRKQANQAFLEAVLRATNSTLVTLPQNQPSQELVALGVLYKGMGWWGLAATAWGILSERHDLDAVDTVLRGAIAAMNIDPQKLALEAAWALEQIHYHDLDAVESALKGEIGNSKSGSWALEKLMEIYQDNRELGSLYHQLPQVPANPQWERAREVNLSPESLVRALKHPSKAIAQNATVLLMHGVGGAEAAGLVREAFREDNEQVLWAIAANIAPCIWGDEAAEIVLDRLEEPLTQDSRCYLLKSLPRLPEAENNQRTLKALLSGLLVEDPKIATMAAEALFEFESSVIADLAPQLKEALEHWTRCGSWCDQHTIPVQGYSCPKCRTVTSSPCPKLVQVLTKLRQLSFEEMIKLCGDQRDDVQETAIDALVEMVAQDSDTLDNLLTKIYSGVIPAKVLTKIFSLPVESLRMSKSKLIELFDASSADIRESIVQALTSADWLDREEAISLARRVLQDNDLAVRDQAVATLRILES